MDVSINWKSAMAFSAMSEGKPHMLDLDTDEGGTGLKPMELMAIGVGGCTAMDVISILEKKRQEVTAFEVKVHTEKKEEYPQIWTEVIIEYIVTGKDVDPAAVERAIQLSADKYCPAQNIVNKSVDIEHRYQIVEAE